MNSTTRLILALATCFIGGCDVTWSPGSGYDNAVFSETGDNIAMVFQTYEKKDNVKYVKKRNFETQVVLMDASGITETLTELTEGDVNDLFFQEEAGYIILGRRGKTELGITGSTYAKFHYERISMDGTVTPLGVGFGAVMLSCNSGETLTTVSPPERWIPSPDGSMLARIKTGITCWERTMTLTFVDAQTLEPLYAPVPLDDGGQTTLADGTNFWNTLSMAWTEDGSFAIGNWATSDSQDHLMADIYAPGQTEPTEDLMHFTCFSAPTASGYQSTDGTEVSVTNAGVLNINPDSVWDGAFGCGSD